MKILICVSGNADDFVFEQNQIFVYEQIEAIKRLYPSVDYKVFAIKGKGIKGYLSQLNSFKLIIQEYKPDIIHAHYGLCGLFANLQRFVPVITTYHGSDINNSKSRIISKISVFLSKYNIFVSSKLAGYIKIKKCFSIIPCGVSFDDYPSISKIEARKLLGYLTNEKLVLFSSAFDNSVKNAKLAIAAVERLSDVRLIELKGYSRSQVNMLLRASDVALLTSFTEGSPQFIKEALVTGCPIVSVDVGDVKELMEGVRGCYIAKYEEEDVSAKIQKALDYGKSTDGYNRIVEKGYDNKIIAEKIFNIYQALKSYNDSISTK